MPAATATRMTTTTTQTDLLRLLTFLSPAFPTGGFAYSHGLETAVEAGDIADADSLQVWLSDVLRHGSGRADVILLRHAHAGSDVAELSRAVPPCRERRDETLGQGRAFRLAARPWADIPDDLPHAVAVGALAGRLGIEVDAAAAAWLHGFAANLISAAVRLVPLGQSDGLRVLAALEPEIVDIAANTQGAGLDDVGGACFRSDIAAMQHETLHTRLFRS